MSDNLVQFLNQEFQMHERVNSFKNRKFYNAEIELTNGCCLSCKYCYVNSRQRPTHNLRIETAKKLIDSLINYDLKHFWWGGGEPLLNQNWRDILGYAKEKGAVENLVFTNGVLLTKNACRDLYRLADRVTIHLDTIKESSFIKTQIYKNRAGDLHRSILHGIDNLLDSGFNPNMVRWNITLTRTILPDLEDTMKYAIHDKKMRTIVLIPLFSCGRAKTIYQKEKPSTADLERAFTLRSRIESRPYLLRLGPSEFCKQYQLTCFAINANGDVLPYVDCFISAGNIYRENICDIIERNFDFLSFQQLVSSDTYKNELHGKCKGCIEERYCFGNPTMTLNNGGQLWDSDPNCWLGEST